MKILVINGPNLNWLGARNQDHYGDHALENIENNLKWEFSEDKIDFFQSNIEGEIISKIQTADSAYDGFIINPGGYAHTSVAIRDALEICKIPKVEVHLSNLSTRDDFRQYLITAAVCDGYISGFKELSYYAAVYLLKKLKSKT